MNTQINNPLHGVTLKKILEDLVEEYGFDILAEDVNVNCFKHDPTIKSSLTFLRKTSWAREKVEKMWIDLKKDEVL
ncbi:VF530 family protein [Patescibacteria group bacterium]|nr:VF530 family protein [Patescibacteria group bacterium]MBU1721549.1 VF530 family protein [Patescibacteria group bacterium]MBU1901473.1 VF530 family protein [Patescibacteria group bacterium]